MFGCQQVLVDSDPVLEFVCGQANKLTNCGIYYARQLFFKTGNYIGKYSLNYECKSSKHFQALSSYAAQQTLISVWESFKSYRESHKLWQEGKLASKPKMPSYRTKDGLAVVSYPKQALKLVDGRIRLPLGRLVKTWFGIDSFFVPMPPNIEFKSVREVRILPRHGCFYAEYVYKVERIRVDLDPSKALGIDSGLSNWLTCVSTCGTSFIVDGMQIKSINRWYNKQVSIMKKGKPPAFWSKRLASAAEKRNRQIRDAVNKSARIVVDHCIKNGIGVIVFGWNKGQKNEINLGKKTNQKFVQIPTARLKERIAQLSDRYGIRFIETEESYTSQASFIDSDTLPTFGEKPEGWKASGKRVKRGLYRTANNHYINADCNGAANILRKVSATLGLDLSGVTRAALTQPTRIQLWVTAQNKKLRNGLNPNCVALFENP